MLLQTCYRWQDACTTELWPFAVKFTVALHNATPGSSGQSPEEIFSVRQSRCRLNDFNTFGCPVFVLQTKLQAGNSIPKWEPRSRMAVYLSHSPQHASNVPLVLSIRTELVSPQYHVVYDDHFTTTWSLKTNILPPNWSELFKLKAKNVLSNNPAIAEAHQLGPGWPDPPILCQQHQP